MASVASVDDVGAAHRRIAPYVRVTPVARSDALDELLGCRVHWKLDCQQLTGSFKVRGAFNQLLQLPTSVRGVVTHSSGNHGAALAYAAHVLRRACTVVMPHNAPAAKVANVRRWGATVVRCDAAARESTVDALVRASQGALHFVHPSAPLATLIGQGTVALELQQQCRVPLAAVLAPVGGGGLLAGCAVAAPSTPVWGCEPAAAGPDALLAWRTGREHRPTDPGATVADGLRTHLSGDALRVVHERVAGILE